MNRGGKIIIHNNTRKDIEIPFEHFNVLYGYDYETKKLIQESLNAYFNGKKIDSDQIELMIDEHKIEKKDYIYLPICCYNLDEEKDFFLSKSSYFRKILMDIFDYEFAFNKIDFSILDYFDSNSWIAFQKEVNRELQKYGFTFSIDQKEINSNFVLDNLCMIRLNRNNKEITFSMLTQFEKLSMYLYVIKEYMTRIKVDKKIIIFIDTPEFHLLPREIKSIWETILNLSLDHNITLLISTCNPICFSCYSNMLYYTIYNPGVCLSLRDWDLLIHQVALFYPTHKEEHIIESELRDIISKYCYYIQDHIILSDYKIEDLKVLTYIKILLYLLEKDYSVYIYGIYHSPEFFYLKDDK